jgi:YbbR domain-containing protein
VTRRCRPYLVVRVSSDNASERLSVRLLGKKGKTLKKATMSVQTNRSVKVTKLSKRVKTAKVALAG